MNPTRLLIPRAGTILHPPPSPHPRKTTLLHVSKRKKRKRKHREAAPSPTPPDPLSEFQSLSEDRRKRLAHEWAAVDAMPVTVGVAFPAHVPVTVDRGHVHSGTLTHPVPHTQHAVGQAQLSSCPRVLNSLAPPRSQSHHEDLGTLRAQRMESERCECRPPRPIPPQAKLKFLVTETRRRMVSAPLVLVNCCSAGHIDAAAASRSSHDPPLSCTCTHNLASCGQLSVPADFGSKSAGQQRNILLSLLRRNPGPPMCSKASACRCHAGEAGCPRWHVTGSMPRTWWHVSLIPPPPPLITPWARHSVLCPCTTTVLTSLDWLPVSLCVRGCLRGQTVAPVDRPALASSSRVATGTAPPTPSPTSTLCRCGLNHPHTRLAQTRCF